MLVHCVLRLHSDCHGVLDVRTAQYEDSVIYIRWKGRVRVWDAQDNLLHPSGWSVCGPLIRGLLPHADYKVQWFYDTLDDMGDDTEER